MDSMPVKPLSAPGLEPNSVQGFLHPWARLVFRLSSRIFHHTFFFSRAPVLPCSRALLFLFSLAPLLLSSFAVVHAQPGWDPEQQVTSIRGAANAPRAAAVGDTIHLVFWEFASDSLGAYEECYYLRSTDEGTTWDSPLMISSRDDTPSVNSRVGVSGQLVHVIWQDGGGASAPFFLRYRRSLDGGRTWGRVDTVFRNAFSGWLAVSGDTLYAGSLRGATGGTYFARSTNAGAAWSPRRLISTEGSGDFRIGCFNRTVHVVRTRNNPVDDVSYLRSTDAGQSWEGDTAVSEVDSLISINPVMGIDRYGSPHISWCDWKYSPFPQTGDIFTRTGSDSGTVWGLIDSLTVEHRAFESDILAVKDTLHLAWDDDRADPGYNKEIYYRMSANLGLTWGPEYRLTYAPRWSAGPSLVASRNYIHVFWNDDRDTIVSGQVIYHRRKSRLVGVEEKRPVISQLKGQGLTLEVSPNPVSKKCLISFRPQTLAGAVVRIFDVLGREVRKFHVEEAGLVWWDLTDNKGKEVGSGVYFVQVVTSQARSERRKFTVLRSK